MRGLVVHDSRGFRIDVEPLDDGGANFVRAPDEPDHAAVTAALRRALAAAGEDVAPDAPLPWLVEAAARRLR